MRWIDFRIVKDQARFERVLQKYGLRLEPRKNGAELVGLCPFHKDSKPSFGVSVSKGLFNCFGCGAKGNVLDFVSRKEGVTLREAAELIAGWQGIQEAWKEKPARGRGEGTDSRAPHCGAEETEKKGEEQLAGERKKDEAPSEPSQVGLSADEAGDLPAGEVGLKPLTFELRGLDASHPYVQSRGVSREQAEYFGVGFCSRGMMKGRIAIPLNDLDGNLVGYLGRWPADDGFPEGEGKYKLPAGFPKSKIVFNLHRVKGEEHLVIVEGVWSVFRLHSLGVSAVALLGSDLSEEQEKLLISSSARRITLLFDGDDAGKKATAEILPRLARSFFVRVVNLPDGTQPDTVPEEELKKLLSLPA